jgi:hypothetical protein
MPELRRFPQYLRRAQASEYLQEVWGLQYAESTLARLCCQGEGPTTHYDGRTALHTPEALDAFAKSRITRTKTRRPRRADARHQPEARP